MREFECKCKCRVFSVNKKDCAIICPVCKSRFRFKVDRWVEFDVVRAFFKNVCSSPKKTLRKASDNVSFYVKESVGAFRKRLNIERVKKKVEFKSKKRELLEELDVVELNKYKEELALERIQLEKRWKDDLVLLKKKGFVYWDSNEHFGKLRGKNIAKKFYGDCKKLGLDVRLVFRKDRGFVELVVQ